MLEHSIQGHTFTYNLYVYVGGVQNDSQKTFENYLMWTKLGALTLTDNVETNWWVSQATNLQNLLDTCKKINVALKY